MNPDRIDPTIAQINAQLGRRLRVLHIGNIANNAYNNARIQRQSGIDADVICYNYYHIMAAPEWEDGGLSTKVDPNLPNWWATNLKGFQRPDWYVQGPLDLCLAYLEARHCGDVRRQRALATSMEQSYIDLLHFNTLARGERWHDPRSLIQRYPGITRLSFAGSPTRKMLDILAAIRDRLLCTPRSLRDSLHELRRMVIWPLLAAAAAKPPRIALSRIILGSYALLRRILRSGARDSLEIAGQVEGLVSPGSRTAPLQIVAQLPRLILRIVWLLTFMPIAIVLARGSLGNHPATVPHDSAVRGREIAAQLLQGEPKVDVAGMELHEEFENYITGNSLPFARVLAHYDVVQGYSIDGIIPLANGHPAFSSYEHGTLRELPFEDSLTGLICRIAYRHSPAVFITNTDVLPSVERLGLAPERVHYLPHAFDEKKLMRWRDAHPELKPSTEDVVFFSPTRQHWRDEKSLAHQGE